MTTRDLAVWLYGDHVATIDPDNRGRPRLTYSDRALDKYALGTPLLSLSLSLRRERYPQGVVRAFLDGLLPEGNSRRAAAEDFGLRADDTYGLIRALGRDCAGAIVIQPAADPPPPPATTTSAERLSDDDVASLVANLRSAPLGVAERVRISLAGVQEKLVLTRMPDGAWGRPIDGTPSTHILKPELAEYPNTVENEAFCMRFAKHLGLSVAEIETTVIGGRKLIVVQRYDRLIAADATVTRLHQEDLCQATGTEPAKKYEENGGPSLRRVAGVLDVSTAAESLERLLQAVTVHVLIGNGDAHAKNYSLLYDPPGTLRLSPLYDLLSTLHYGDDRLAMSIDTVQRTDRVTADRIVNEAVNWGMTPSRAASIVANILERTPAALAAADAETPGLPEAIASLVERQLGQIQTRFSAAGAA